MGKMGRMFLEQQESLMDSMYMGYEQEDYGMYDPEHEEAYRVEMELEAEHQYRKTEIDFNICKLVFVYGTLQSGCGNNRLLKESKLIGNAITKDKYLQTISGSVPYVNKHVNHCQVMGELWQIKDLGNMLNLDGLESHPNWYCREIITVITEDGQEHKAWIYFNEKSMGDNIIYDGNYKTYIKNYYSEKWW